MFHILFLSSAFAKLRKATINFVRSIRPSVCMEHFGSHWTDFCKILYLNISRNSVEKIQVLTKSDKRKGTLHQDLSTCMTVACSICRMRNISEKICKQTFHVKFFSLENRAVYEVCKNVVEPAWPQMTV
jgi:hypothetical protein